MVLHAMGLRKERLAQNQRSCPVDVQAADVVGMRDPVVLGSIIAQWRLLLKRPTLPKRQAKVANQRFHWRDAEVLALVVRERVGKKLSCLLDGGWD